MHPILLFFFFFFFFFTRLSYSVSFCNNLLYRSSHLIGECNSSLASQSCIAVESYGLVLIKCYCFAKRNFIPLWLIMLWWSLWSYITQLSVIENCCYTSRAKNLFNLRINYAWWMCTAREKKAVDKKRCNVHLCKN